MWVICSYQDSNRFFTADIHGSPLLIDITRVKHLMVAGSENKKKQIKVVRLVFFNAKYN